MKSKKLIFVGAIVKKQIIACGLFLAAVSVTNAYAQLSNAPVVFRSGEWRVVREVDKMTDKIDCTGLLGDGNGNQLTADTFYVDVRGGVESVTLRFGDSVAKPLRLAKPAEKDVRSVILEGADFQQLLDSERLRVQVLTVLRDLVVKDLNVKGVREAVENIKAGCPVPAPKEVVASTEVKKPSEPLCAKIVMDRMRAAKIKESQIASICREDN